ncbi:UDP-glycosyltransferase UGT5-like [Schistocerca piceifrons]|uniref:UDP-glycosyltransferase UGT5-like n=1 Tax=Schistocerca piceifrons TaxID=274613 RepID=UPI001F5EF174|nr:UDP-glycosyltransferase UGT5-like [Schistocerca piceifrons]
MRTAVFLAAACLLTLGDRCLGARILAVVPTPSISHQLPLRTVLLELARRGHQVTFITTHPIQDVRDFLGGARDGVVYFSLGSNVRSSAIPPETVRAFLDAFAGIPQRVLWKWEADRLPSQPSNVMTAKWLPQQDVLGECAGGLQSWNEAAYFSVPVIGIPFLGDQVYNVEKMVGLGVGRRLDLKDVTKDSVFETVQTVLEDKSYQENMKHFSTIYREHQSTSLERAVWWVEYVIRHQGAPHLRSTALDLHWWQLLLLDVIAFILAVAAVAAFLLYKLTRWLITWLTRPSKLKNQ